MGQQPTETKSTQNRLLYRFIDRKQPEVRWAATLSVLLEILFIILTLRSNFFVYENDICSLIHCIIAGLIGFIGVAIAGIAIVIALFTSKQIKMINELKPGAFECLLFDFKWFALVSAIETAIFISIVFVIRSPYPVASRVVFYIATLFLTYSIFYLLFYGWALIGNFIKLANIKCTLDNALAESKSVPIAAIEVQLDFLVSQIFQGDKQSARKFYSELIEKLANGSQANKEEIVAYLKERYDDF